MCGGGGRSSPAPDDRMLDLQREQMAEQKRQYEEQKAEQATRYAEQKAIAEAPPAPTPSPVAETAAAALDLPDPSGSLASTGKARKKGYGRKQFRTDLEAGSGLNIPA